MGANEKHEATFYDPASGHANWVPDNQFVYGAYLFDRTTNGTVSARGAANEFNRWLEQVRAEAKAEALELYRAFQHVRTDGVFDSVPSFASLSEPQQAEWLAVARRARELAKEATK